MAAFEGRRSGPWAAIQFLTRLPVPHSLTRADDFASALAWFPAVGLLLGAILATADALLRLAFDPLVVAALDVVLLLGLTGALHADGLVDTADAAFATATPERRLKIMRDPHAGSFGVAALASILLLKVAGVDALPSAERASALVLAPLLGRWAIVVVATCFPYGRPTGLGAPLKQAATPRTLLLASLLPLAVAAAAWPAGLALLLAAAGVAWLVGRWLVGKLPGLTGDSYGAVCEVVEAATLLLATPLARALEARWP